MASWDDTRRLLQRRYLTEDVGPDAVRVFFSTGGGRTQMALVVRLQTHRGDEWVRVSSRIGHVGEVDLLQAAAALADRAVGGLVVFGDDVEVAASAPLDGLQASGLVRPLEIVATIADELEGALLGRDSA